MPETVSFSAPDGESFDARVARPAGEPIGGVIVIHEIWGLVDHIVDVAERYAAQGYLAVAPDILSHGGVAPALGAELFAVMNSPDEAERVAAQPRMREAMTAMRSPDYAQWAVGALTRVVDWLEAQPGVDGRIGVTGFCFGGTYTFLLATADARVRAAVPYYGSAPPADRIAGIRAPVLAIYGQHDPNLIDALPELRERMTEAGVDFETVVYPEAAHAFFNDTGPRYRAGEAADAWQRTLAFFRDRLA